MAEQVTTTPERYVDKQNISEIVAALKEYIDYHGGGITLDDYVTENSSHGVKSSGIYTAIQAASGGSEPDGTTVVNRNASGNIESMVFTYDGGVTTTSFAETSTSKIIVEEDVKTGATTATVRTTIINDDQIVTTTTVVPVD